MKFTSDSKMKKISESQNIIFHSSLNQLNIAYIPESNQYKHFKLIKIWLRFRSCH